MAKKEDEMIQAAHIRGYWDGSERTNVPCLDADVLATNLKHPEWGKPLCRHINCLNIARMTSPVRAILPGIDDTGELDIAWIGDMLLINGVWLEREEVDTLLAVVLSGSP